MRKQPGSLFTWFTAAFPGEKWKLLPGRCKERTSGYFGDLEKRGIRLVLQATSEGKSLLPLFWPWALRGVFFCLVWFLCVFFFFFKREGKGGRKREKETLMWETSIGCLLHMSQLGAQPTTLTRNQTSDPLLGDVQTTEPRHSGQEAFLSSIWSLLMKNYNKADFLKKLMSWLVWLSGLGVILKTERSLVQFPVRAHVWVVGQVSRWGVWEAIKQCFSPSIPLSLLLSLKNK